jgi:hypothetical protein
MILLSLTVAVALAHAQGSSVDQAAVTQPATGPVNSLTDPGAVRPIGIIDFYGLHRLTAEQLRNALTFKVGDLVKFGDLSFSEASKQRLMMISGVAHAQRGISGRLATWSDLLGAGYRCKGLLAVGQVRT